MRAKQIMEAGENIRDKRQAYKLNGSLSIKKDLTLLNADHSIKFVHNYCEGSDQLEIRGKFLYLNNKKYYIKGVTYGTFQPQADGSSYPHLNVIKKDFSMMVNHGINSIRTYTVPPPELLDLAQQYGLKVMVGIPWEQHITFLDHRDLVKDIINRVRRSILQFKNHPAILCYAIGNEIPASIVRWYGRRKIEKFLKQLFLAAKEEDPNRLITYVNYPTTEYLNLSFLDFLCFNVYLETPEKLSNYLSKLHNLAEDKPLVLAEIGMDSLRNGEENQAALLNWQIPIIYSKGCAGMFVFAWTDEWWRGGYEINDWKFGLVDIARIPKPALNTVKDHMNRIPAVIQENYQPKISVVVCSYNGSATISNCLSGILELDYPNFETIVVNDGSTDNLEAIVRRFPVKLISTPNQGLSAARNIGMEHATGEIIAYLDDDAYPDPHWLTYLAAAYRNSAHAGIGGPNLSPYNDAPVATCVANSPGGPVHVLLTDEIAEHIPGCNMSFRKAVLEEIGGFDPTFRIAGDDVDLCWRVQKAGYTLGFHPTALVWHHRRNNVKAYWKQQKAYGKAEALLEAKWPEKYNVLGHLSWSGRIYSNGSTQALNLGHGKVFHGTWGTALFQSIYEPANGLWSSIPLMPEWYALIAILACLGCFGLIWDPLLWAWPFCIACFFIVLVQATESAKKYTGACTRKLCVKYRLLVICLHLIQPLARLYGRVSYGLTPWKTRYCSDVGKYLLKFRPHVFNYWSAAWRLPENWLSDIEKELLGIKLRVSRGGDFDKYDLQVYNGMLTKVKLVLAIEEHGGGNQYLRLKCWLAFSFRKMLFIAAPAMMWIIFITRERWMLSAIVGILTLFLITRIIVEHAGCLSCINKAFNGLKEKYDESHLKKEDVKADKLEEESELNLS